jgi:hypothetical protein
MAYVTLHDFRNQKTGTRGRHLKVAHKGCTFKAIAHRPWFEPRIAHRYVSGRVFYLSNMQSASQLMQCLCIVGSKGFNTITSRTELFPTCQVPLSSCSVCASCWIKGVVTTSPPELSSRYTLRDSQLTLCQPAPGGGGCGGMTAF